MVTIGPATVPKQFVLCFDGTGNKFSGDESDSNVLKIFRMLDRSKSHQFHYYQPGIGTYVTTTSLSNHGRIHRIRSAYLKAKDSAIGSSFAEHVLGGYKFLMRYYSPGDEIYFIGFSRGAYIARFLAEMLDYIGLLEAGNEELIRFAWKTFAKWQQRRGATDEEREEKKKLFNYMKAFRETFSRPITRIKFMGLFDTVNSVPRFESAWMQRSKFPYTARSSAKVIRHAVGIDERRAKFRQDLISEVKPWVAKKQQSRPLWKAHPLPLPSLHDLAPHCNWESSQDAPKDNKNDTEETTEKEAVKESENDPESDPERADNLPTIVLNDDKNDATEEPALLRPRPREHGEIESVYRTPRSSQAGSIHHEHREDRYRAPSPQRKLSLAVPMMTASTEDLSLKSGKSGLSLRVESVAVADEEEEDETTQDIQEVWFPGGHADIGGGWKLESGERWPLSHAPLVWMVQEAQRAGLQFDSRKLKQFECCEEYSGEYSPIRDEIFDPFDPVEEHAENCQEPHDTGEHVTFRIPVFGGEKQQSASSFNFFNALHLSSTKGVLHDCLQYGKGLSFTSVLSWRIMEYLPFRRMDLQPDGSWKPIRWPLPCGEVRDIPYDARIHISAIRRMQADANYRPGNLIIGGGGRGVRRAPEKYGIGEWVVLRYEGDTVRETYVRKSVSKRCSEGH